MQNAQMQMVATSSKQSRGWMWHRSMPLRLLQSKGRKRSKMDTRVKPSPLGVRIYNHTFSSMPSSVELQDCSLQRCEIPEDGRRDIWKIGKGNWDTNPKLLGLRDHTGLSREYDQQNNILPKGKTRKHKLVLDFDAEVAKLEQRLNRRQKRNQIRREVWARKLQQADDSSSSSSTTSSEDSSE